MRKLFLGIICILISFNVFSFTKIIEANGEEQIHILNGRDGRNGSNVHCTSDGPRRRGKDGSDGEDAGSVLIKFNKIEDLKLIKIVSNPGKGGRGGKGCNGGGRGHSGQSGEHVLVHLYDLNLGIEYKADVTVKKILTKDLNQEIAFSKNIWEKKIKINELLALGSNPQNNYFNFVKRKELIAKTLINDEMNIDEAKLELTYDYQNDDVKLSSMANSLLLLQKEQLNNVFTFLIDKIYSEQDLFKFTAEAIGKKESLKLVLSSFVDVFTEGIEVEVSLVVYNHGLWGNEIKKIININADKMFYENEKLILDLGELDLKQYKTFLKRDFLGVDIKFKANFNTIQKLKYSEVKF